MSTLAIRTVFFSLIPLITPQFVQLNLARSQPMRQSSRSSVLNWLAFLSTQSRITRDGLKISKHTTSFKVILTGRVFLYLYSGDFPFPLIAGERSLAVELGMLDPDELDKSGMPLTARCVFIIGPDKVFYLCIKVVNLCCRNSNSPFFIPPRLGATLTKLFASSNHFSWLPITRSPPRPIGTLAKSAWSFPVSVMSRPRSALPLALKRPNFPLERVTFDWPRTHRNNFFPFCLKNCVVILNEG